MVQKKITTYITRKSKKSSGSGGRFRRRTLKRYSGARVFKMRRTQRLGTITLNTGYNDVSGNATTPWFTAFNIDMLPARTEITNLFQQYRVKGLKFRISPRFDSVDINNVNIPWSIPKWYVAVDKDCSVDSSTEDSMMQQRVKILRGNRDVSIYASYPKFRNMITNSTTSAVGFNAVNKWITSNDPDVNHCSYAIGAYAPIESVAGVVYDVWCTAYIHAKGLK